MAEINLVIVRHAQAEDGGFFNTDSERRLTPRGQRDASAVGRLRKQLNLPKPDLVFSSGYDRAEQTLERVLEGQVVNIIRDLAFSPEGSVQAAWNIVLREVDQKFSEGRGCVWIFGHNPNIERLITLLAPQLGMVLRPFRKASLAWLRIQSETQGTSVAELVAYIPRPRDGRDNSA